MALTHAGVSESSQLLVAAPTQAKKTAPEPPKPVITAAAPAPRPVTVTAAAAAPTRKDSVAVPPASPAATATSPNIVNKAEEERIKRDKLAAQVAKEKADAEAEKQALLANLSPDTSSPDIQQRIANATNKLANAKESEGSLKLALEQALAVLNEHLSQRIAKEKSDAYTEKQALLADVSSITSLQIRVRIDSAEKTIASLSQHENHRRPPFDEALVVLKEHLERRLVMEEDDKEILALQRECREQLSNNKHQPQLPTGIRAQYRSNVVKCHEQLQAKLKDFKQADPNSKKCEEVAKLVETVAANLKQTEEYERKVESSLQTMIGIKAKFAARQMSLEEAAKIAATHDELTRGIEQSPEVRENVTAVLEMCKDLEKRADEDAVASVQSGVTLRKYAREKILKKSSHEPAASAVKIGAGMTLLWGSHKDGPQIKALAVGPSQALAESGLLGSRYFAFGEIGCVVLLLRRIFRCRILIVSSVRT